MIITDKICKELLARRFKLSSAWEQSESLPSPFTVMSLGLTLSECPSHPSAGSPNPFCIRGGRCLESRARLLPDTKRPISHGSPSLRSDAWRTSAGALRRAIHIPSTHSFHGPFCV